MQDEVAFFAVAAQLLNPSAAIPPPVRQEVGQELYLIGRQQGVVPSPVMNMGAGLERLALNLKTIAEKELNNTPLAANDYELIRSFGGQLEHFRLEALRNEGVDHRSLAADNPAPASQGLPAFFGFASDQILDHHAPVIRQGVVKAPHLSAARR